jgi:ectoine hydroxylase-related dioxygenase (phytanoyl-CoA dioxygenase family)
MRADAIPVVLPDDQLHCFQRQGVVTIDQLTDENELVWLREIYDAIIKRKTGVPPQALDVGTRQHVTGSLVTVFFPERLVPVLTHTHFLRNACYVGACLLGVTPTQLSQEWRLVCKPARGGTTAWHQDAMYHVDRHYRPLSHQGVTVWMPLDPVTEANGCLYHIKGSHLEDIRSHSYEGGYMHIDEIDISSAEPCVLAAGTAAFHHCRTLHSAGPNSSMMPRRAIQIIFQVMPNEPGTLTGGED